LSGSGIGSTRKLPSSGLIIAVAAFDGKPQVVIRVPSGD
jgi:hypothetical protein